MTIKPLRRTPWTRLVPTACWVGAAAIGALVQWPHISPSVDILWAGALGGMVSQVLIHGSSRAAVLRQGLRAILLAFTALFIYWGLWLLVTALFHVALPL